MVRYMADSTDCNQFTAAVDIPGKGQALISLTAGYLPPSSYAASSQRCGGTSVKIDVAGVHPEADVLDIEQFDATPATAPGWVVEHNKVSSYPGILYVNRSNIHEVANALVDAGLEVVKDYRWWIATLDGTESVADMTGVTAVQAWSANYFKTNIDLSVVYDDAWKPTSKPTPGPQPTPLPHPSAPVYYRVKVGDTLTSIGRSFGVSVNQLVTWNHITNPNYIQAGQVLIVGWGSPHVPVHYIVRAGDTLTSIAAQYHTSVHDLVAWNHIANPNLIYPNEVLVVGYE